MFDYYADSAVLVFEPGVSVTKSEEMKAGIKQYFEELKPRLTADVRLAYQAGDLALMIVSYTLETTQDGVTTKKEGTATDIAVKSPDGKWRYAVDNHYGTELPG
nr:DUF4440 domain-containing protein [Nocardiopsis chromatogenes]